MAEQQMSQEAQVIAGTAANGAIVGTVGTVATTAVGFTSIGIVIGTVVTATIGNVAAGNAFQLLKDSQLLRFFHLFLEVEAQSLGWA